MKYFEIPTKEAICLYSKPKSKSASSTSKEGRMFHACLWCGAWGPHDTIPQVPPPNVPPRIQLFDIQPWQCISSSTTCPKPHTMYKGPAWSKVSLSLASIISCCPNVRCPSISILIVTQKVYTLERPKVATKSMTSKSLWRCKWFQLPLPWTFVPWRDLDVIV